jgi:hypothetical protein
MPPAKKRGAGHGDMKQYKFKPFDWNWFRYDSTMLVFGQRGTGKTNFSRNVLLRNRLRRCLVICESPEINRSWKDIPFSYRYPEFNEDYLKSILRAQNKIAKDIISKFQK